MKYISACMSVCAEIFTRILSFAIILNKQVDATIPCLIYNLYTNIYEGKFPQSGLIVW